MLEISDFDWKKVERKISLHQKYLSIVAVNNYKWKNLNGFFSFSLLSNYINIYSDNYKINAGFKSFLLISIRWRLEVMADVHTCIKHCSLRQSTNIEIWKVLIWWLLRKIVWTSKNVKSLISHDRNWRPVIIVLKDVCF